MVITNPAEQLRGLPGPTEPNYQNKPATTTCREEGGRKEVVVVVGGEGRRRRGRERRYKAGERFR